jgi:hypothetical protein
MKSKPQQKPVPDGRRASAPPSPATEKQPTSTFPATSDVLCVFAFLWAEPEEDK